MSPHWDISTGDVRDRWRSSTCPTEFLVPPAPRPPGRSCHQIETIGEHHVPSHPIPATLYRIAADIDSAVVLIDGSGKVVGGEWLDFWSAPEHLAAGEKLSTEASVAVSGGKPVKVEVYTWAD